MRWPIFACLAGMLVCTAWGQRYELVQPNGYVGAIVEIEGSRLLVQERTGERLSYSREQRYDSPDGLFLGYFNFQWKRVLRFPRSGQGQMQMADLDDAVPRFRYTQRIARPAATSRPRGPAVPWRPGIPVTPGGYAGSPYDEPYQSGYRFFPQSVLIDSRVVPNPPLPPARIQLLNGGRREIQVGVVDLRNPAATRSVRIQPQRAIEMEVDRDSGSQRVDTFRTITSLGETITKEIVRPIPPAILYEVVVHQWEMQSIAIDRTGKSPQVIEDINFQGRGLGRFPLPPGNQLNAGTIDVYRAAIESGNPGAVAPIVAQEQANSPPTSPLERAILDVQRRAQSGNRQ